MLTEHGPACSEIHKYYYFSKHAPLTLTARSDGLMAMGGLVRLLTHDFTHETIYRSHAAFDFAAPKELGAMDIPGGPISPSTVTKIFVFNPGGPIRSRRQSGLFTAARLNTCLFIKAHHEFIGG